MTTYRYTEKDLLEKPHKYQYTPFEGEALFTAYAEDRRKATSFFSKQNEPTPSNGYTAVNPNEIVVRIFLMQQLKKLEEQSWKFEDERKMLLKLVQRFEVSKRIYDRYDIQSIKKSENALLDLCNFPLFGLVLIAAAKTIPNHPARFIFMNAAIKIGDILSSASMRFEAHAALCRRFFEAEMEWMRSAYGIV